MRGFHAKICLDCGQWKSLADFHVRKSNLRDGCTKKVKI